jgi:hypothetical protein
MIITTLWAARGCEPGAEWRSRRPELWLARAIAPSRTRLGNPSKATDQGPSGQDSEVRRAPHCELRAIAGTFGCGHGKKLDRTSFASRLSQPGGMSEMGPHEHAHDRRPLAACQWVRGPCMAVRFATGHLQWFAQSLVPVRVVYDVPGSAVLPAANCCVGFNTIECTASADKLQFSRGLLRVPIGRSVQAAQASGTGRCG